MWDEMASRLIDQNVTKRLAKVMDASVLGVTALLATFYFAKPEEGQQQHVAVYLVILLVLSTLLAIRAFGLYEPRRWREPILAFIVTFSAASITGIATYALAALTPLHIQSAWLLAWLGATSIYVLISRLVAGAWINRAYRQGRFHRRVAIVGGGKAADQAVELLEKDSNDVTEIVGLFDDRFDDRSPENIGWHRKLGNINDLSAFARSNRIDLIIVAIPMSAEKRLLHILNLLWELPVDIRISATASELKLSPSAYSYLGHLPLLNVFERPLSGWNAFMKDCLDRCLAASLLVILSPVLAAIGLAVKLDSKGPVIFRQKRFGFNNQVVEVLKFRSLYADQGDVRAQKLVTKDDPRVTRVGRFIRKSSLDELPQLVNVLRGELSLVGPRPHATQAKAAGTLYEQVVEGYFARHKVKPGITGWAQINGWRGETDTREKLEQRVKHDLEYIDRWSLGLDLYILAKTPFSLLKTENAY
jgi:Undecaprenyl-phosphate glucose phosphotransferase